MPQPRVSAERNIPAPAEAAYTLLADYGMVTPASCRKLYTEELDLIERWATQRDPKGARER